MTFSYLRQSIKTYMKSFANIRLLGLAFMLNLAFVLLLYFGLSAVKIILQPRLEIARAINMEGALQNLQEMQAAASTVKGLFFIVIFTSAVFFLFTVLIFSISQGIAWCKSLNKKPTISFLGKFALLNLIWISSLTALIILFIVVSNPGAVKAVLLALFTIFLYFTPILFFLFIKKQKIPIKETLKLGIKKFHYFLLPYLIIILTFILIQKLSLMPYIMLPIYLLFFSWVQNYAKDIILQIQKA